MSSVRLRLKAIREVDAVPGHLLESHAPRIFSWPFPGFPHTESCPLLPSIELSLFNCKNKGEILDLWVVLMKVWKRHRLCKLEDLGSYFG